MSYTELIAEMQSLLGDGEGLLNLITLDNLNVVSKCVNKPFAPNSLQLTNPRTLLDSYTQLVSDLGAAGTTTAALVYYVPANVLLRSYGEEYQARYSVIRAKYVEAGVADPDASTVQALQDEADALVISQNSQPVDPCL